MSPREAVLTLYLVCGVLGVIALFLREASVVEAYAIAGATFLAGAFALVRLEWRWLPTLAKTSSAGPLVGNQPSAETPSGA